jgi:hypothetical protein
MPKAAEIREHFYIKYANKLTDLLMDIKKEYEDNGMPLLNNPCPTMEADFVDIILYNVKEENIINSESK